MKKLEYKILTPNDSKYPKKLIQRLGANCPENIYYRGPLKFLDKFTMSTISSDSIHGEGVRLSHQLLFVIREYAMNYLSPSHSVMETEIFRLGLWKKCKNTVSLFSVKGLAKESYDSFLQARFIPPFQYFPEREEYMTRARNNELLMLSMVEPTLNRHIRQNILERNFITCCLGDIIFIPHGPKKSKTYEIAKRAVELKLPLFTIDAPSEVKDLLDLGIPGFNRKNIRKFLEEKGAPLMSKEEPVTILYQEEKIIKTEEKPIETPPTDSETEQFLFEFPKFKNNKLS